MHTNPKKAGMVGAIMLGGIHVVWSLFILLGWSQWLIGFSMWAHMVKWDVTVGPFDPVAALTLIIVASCIGFVIGFAISTVWNKVHRS